MYWKDFSVCCVDDRRRGGKGGGREMRGAFFDLFLGLVFGIEFGFGVVWFPPFNNMAGNMIK